MHFHVSLQAADRGTREAALLAIEGFLSTVLSHVFLQVTCLCTRIIALFASERFFTTVCQHVSL